MSKSGKTINRWFFALVLAASVCSVLDGRAQSTAPSGASSKVIPVGVTLTIAPYSFVNEKNENVGFELDILRAVSKRMDVDFQFVRIPFAQLFTSLNGDIVQIAASGLIMTCERLKNPTGVGRFSVPTFANWLVITTRAETADRIKSFEDLAGKKIGVENVGTIPDRVVTEAQKKTNFEKVVFTDNPSLFLALEQGRIDAATQGEFPTLWQTRGNPRLKIAAKVPGTYTPSGFVFKDGDTLRDQVNEVLNSMKTDGTMAKIYRTWFNSDPAPESPVGKIVPEVTLESNGCR
jgi:polar amino acid transport system substrate-binding protein